MFPVTLSVRDRSCLVVGGGGVALRKVESLLADGARVTVVAPDPLPEIERMLTDGNLHVERRSYRPGEAVGFALVFAATDDRAVNVEVARDAEAAGIWVNVADDPELCSFHLPARVRRGALQFSISSEGEAPFAVRRLRQLLERRLGPEWAEWLDAAARFRQQVRSLALERGAAEDAYDRFFTETVDAGGLRSRVPSEAQVAAMLGAPAAGNGHTAAPASRGASERPVKAGLVSLVGAGPGDPGLLTLRGRARLLAADAVVYDRLAATAVPCDLPASCELHPVGKEAGNHPVAQEEINALLVRLGQAGKRVVRLKGGDPFVFGRGGEEAEALAAAGVPFEVVPGVTAGIAVPAYAGIPVTHRREAVRLTLLTAHEAIKEEGSQVHWNLLAADPDATIVGYMGVTGLSAVVRSLLAGGMAGDTPAALIERGTTAAQRSVISTLAELPAAVAAAGLKPPALFLIGPTARHASRLDWFSARPLHAERLAIAAGAPAPLLEALELAGAEVLVLPLPPTPAARVAVDALPLTGCLLRSAAEVDALEEERDRSGWQSAVTWCIGLETARRARERGWRRVEQLDAELGVADLAAEIAARRKRDAVPV